MVKSDSIAALAAALAKAQSKMGPAKKDAVNPHFKSRYADLASVWEAARGPLTENGLAVVQTLDDSDRGACVVTTLMHSSGEWISGRLTLPVSKSDAQGYGSAITYARRYGLAAILGIAADDDDGEAAVRAPAARGLPAPPGSSPARPSDAALSYAEIVRKAATEAELKSTQRKIAEAHLPDADRAYLRPICEEKAATFRRAGAA